MQGQSATGTVYKSASLLGLPDELLVEVFKQCFEGKTLAAYFIDNRRFFGDSEPLLHFTLITAGTAEVWRFDHLRRVLASRRTCKKLRHFVPETFFGNMTIDLTIEGLPWLRGLNSELSTQLRKVKLKMYLTAVWNDEDTEENVELLQLLGQSRRLRSIELTIDLSALDNDVMVLFDLDFRRHYDMFELSMFRGVELTLTRGGLLKCDAFWLTKAMALPKEEVNSCAQIEHDVDTETFATQKEIDEARAAARAIELAAERAAAEKAEEDAKRAKFRARFRSIDNIGTSRSW